MKVATFNVNSIRSRAEVLVPWLAEHRPQVLCVQETPPHHGGKRTQFPDSYCL
jgi:exonuclease III